MESRRRHSRTNNTGYVLAAVAVMAIVTYLPRMLPLTLVRKRITNRFCSHSSIMSLTQCWRP